MRSTNNSIKNGISIAGLIMVKNQEERIKNSIKSLYELCDEIIVVDTGSTDKTIETIHKYYPQIKVHHLNWEDNYGEMRNKCLKFITADWVFFLDSDESIESPLSKKELHDYLYTLEKNDTNTNLVCSIKQRTFDRDTFIRADRIYRNTGNFYYFGYVHEELRAHGNIKKINLDITITNYGTEYSEVKKFNKSKRYLNLLLKDMQAEPNNTRWPALLSMRYVEDHNLSIEDYIRILRSYIFINPSIETIEATNLKKSSNLNSLVNQYALILLTQSRIKDAINLIELTEELFPNNMNLITQEFIFKVIEIQNNGHRAIKTLFNKINLMDKNKVTEISQGSEGEINVPIIKLLIIVGRYDDAREIIKDIDNEFILDQLSEEIELLFPNGIYQSEQP